MCVKNLTFLYLLISSDFFSLRIQHKQQGDQLSLFSLNACIYMGVA